MSGYLENYGAGVDRRLRIIKWTVAAALTTLILGTLLYFTFRFHSEESRVESFLAAVKSRDYPKAYSIWGCGEQHPCPDYSMEKFLEDWGPNGAYAPLAAGDLKYIEPCSNGLLFTVVNPGKDPLVLRSDKNDPTLGFAPWALCPEKGVQGISLRKIRLFLSRQFGSGE